MLEHFLFRILAFSLILGAGTHPVLVVFSPSQLFPSGIAAANHMQWLDIFVFYIRCPFWHCVCVCVWVQAWKQHQDHTCLSPQFPSHPSTLLPVPVNNTCCQIGEYVVRFGHCSSNQLAKDLKALPVWHLRPHKVLPVCGIKKLQMSSCLIFYVLTNEVTLELIHKLWSSLGAHLHCRKLQLDLRTHLQAFGAKTPPPLSTHCELPASGDTKKPSEWIINQTHYLTEREKAASVCGDLLRVFGGCTSSTVWPTGSQWSTKTTNKMKNPTGRSPYTDYWQKQNHCFASLFELSKGRSSEFIANIKSL